MPLWVRPAASLGASDTARQARFRKTVCVGGPHAPGCPQQRARKHAFPANLTALRCGLGQGWGLVAPSTVQRRSRAQRGTQGPSFGGRRLIAIGAPGMSLRGSWRARRRCLPSDRSLRRRSRARGDGRVTFCAALPPGSPGLGSARRQPSRPRERDSVDGLGSAGQCFCST
ncbi:uncharacterized protein LOC117035573 isoform X2 [Rhinolophus ferrumequinum]|uniref:uncharacterized protein LOC117035573 isoform X2 n=1 Tax=Rhinolophus ferrumequinum TaxID=59479 RepID=UPI00140F7439|nr:uncharacterized protein LOC117035573 isoform X2 [Rhinolophus ferrumequinum]